MDSLIQRFLDREQKRKPKSYPTRESHLQNFDRWLTMEGHSVLELDGLTIEEFFFDLASDGYAPMYIASHFDTLKVMFSMLDGPFDEIEGDPMEGLEKSDYTSNTARKKETADIVYVTADQVDLMCKNVPEPKLRNELLLRSMFVLGTREAETVDIKLQDIDRDMQSIRVKSLKVGPNQSEYRTVYWHDGRFDTLLTLYMDQNRKGFSHADDSPFLFVSTRSENIDPRQVNKIVNNAAEAAEIQSIMYTDKNGQDRREITSHAFRHGHAVHALKQGIDVRSVQIQLGHSKLEMTMNYLELLDEDVRNSYRKW